MGTIYNERAWGIDLIKEITKLASEKKIIFKGAGGESGLKTATATRRFPDLLLFSDLLEGEVFNGWELKFPDTPVTDSETIENAKEKAEALGANSFVIWNVREADIYIKNEDSGAWSIEKHLGPIKNISKRGDVRPNDGKWLSLLIAIIKELEQLYKYGHIKPALKIPVLIEEATRELLDKMLPNVKEKIRELCGTDKKFRKTFHQWRKDNSHLLPDSKIESAEETLANMLTGRLVYRILFYKSLEMRYDVLPSLLSNESKEFEAEITNAFKSADRIDFRPLFSDDGFDNALWYNSSYLLVSNFLECVNGYSFPDLPDALTSSIIEELIEENRRKIFGLYVTPRRLADFIVALIGPSTDETVFDPCCGSGTFISALYDYYAYYDKDHQGIVSTLWANDVQPMASSITLMKLLQKEISKNIPPCHVYNYDIFKLKSGVEIETQSPMPENPASYENLPLFDNIVANLPYVMQESIKKSDLIAAIKEECFDVLPNGPAGRSDMYAYFLYHLTGMISPGGFLGIITSNSWLSTKWGSEFKIFLMERFNISYVIQSGAERWFEVKVISLILILQKKGKSSSDSLLTKFVTIKKPLNEILPDGYGFDELQSFLEKIENKEDDFCYVREVESNLLKDYHNWGIGWRGLFVDVDAIEDSIRNKLFVPLTNVAYVFRGLRRGANDFFYPDTDGLSIIEEEYMIPLLKNIKEIKTLKHPLDEVTYKAFCCNLSAEELVDLGHVGALDWINRFKDYTGKGDKAYLEKLKRGKLEWYQIGNYKTAKIFCTINPFERLFFPWSEEEVFIDQRLMGIEPKDNVDWKLLVAMLNSLPALLCMETLGFNRGEGVLDLNKDNIEEYLYIPDPRLKQIVSKKDEIISALESISNREVLPIDRELERGDRKKFDTVILKALGLEDKYGELKTALIESVETRNAAKIYKNA